MKQTGKTLKEDIMNELPIFNRNFQEVDKQGQIVAMQKHYRMKRVEEDKFLVLYDGVEIDQIVKANMKIENLKSVQNILKARTTGLSIWVSVMYEKHNIVAMKKERVFDKVCVIHYNEIKERIREAISNSKTKKEVINEKTV